jgi:hypothetical protein
MPSNGRSRDRDIYFRELHTGTEESAAEALMEHQGHYITLLEPVQHAAAVAAITANPDAFFRS